MSIRQIAAAIAAHCFGLVIVICTGCALEPLSYSSDTMSSGLAGETPNPSRLEFQPRSVHTPEAAADAKVMVV
jgi:hypothetical protein